MGFLTGGFCLRGHGFGIAKPIGFVPVANPSCATCGPGARCCATRGPGTCSRATRGPGARCRATCGPRTSCRAPCAAPGSPAVPRAAPVPPPAPARYAQPVQVYWRRSAPPPAPEAPGATQVTSSYLLVQLRNK